MNMRRSEGTWYIAVANIFVQPEMFIVAFLWQRYWRLWFKNGDAPVLVEFLSVQIEGIAREGLGFLPFEIASYLAKVTLLGRITLLWCCLAENLVHGYSMPYGVFRLTSSLVPVPPLPWLFSTT